VTNELLENEKEGVAGEYRKVGIGVMGRKVPRPSPENVGPLMSRWIENAKQKESEHLFELLSRIHTSFHHIHPFRDDNGHVGRLMMNLILLQRGYPIVAFQPTLGSLFNEFVGKAIEGDEAQFTRLLVETLFETLVAYDKALEKTIVPLFADFQ